MKQLILMRHAEADNRHLDNSSRPLTERGCRIQQELSLEIQRRGYCPKRLFASPLLRAQQSAGILAQVCKVSVETEPLLASNFDFEHLIMLLAAYEEERLCCIGHMPTLAYFAQRLVGDEILPAGLRPSQTLILDFDGEPRLGSASLTDSII